MPTYVALCSWTQKGIEGVKQSPARLDKFREAVKAAGGEIKQVFLTMGRYDLVIVAEAPDDTAWARVTLSVGSYGNVRTETLKAFGEQEYRKIIGSLP